MAVNATIIDTATGEPIQKMTFGRMPRLGSMFVLASGVQATVQRVEVGKPTPGRFVTPVSVWVTAIGDRPQP